jgi:hypothetical protein
MDTVDKCGLGIVGIVGILLMNQSTYSLVRYKCLKTLMLIVCQSQRSRKLL